MVRNKGPKTPVTAAVRVLRAHGVSWEPHFYTYEDRGGTAVSSAALGVPEHSMIKTLIMEEGAGQALVVLMHGDREVATGTLARVIGEKRVSPCPPALAERHSGYRVGGTSPFGLRQPMPIYAEASIRELDRLWINGGKRGFLVSLSPEDLDGILSPVWVSVAQPKLSR